MKKILIILSTITLIVTSTTSLAACDNNTKYTSEELAKLKEKRNINTNDGILEWIAPQEKPFNQIDNKYYFVVWRGNKNHNLRIIKFNNNEKIKRWHPKTLGEQNNIKLCLTNYAEIPIDIDLSIDASTINRWKNDTNNHFKTVYRWNNDSEPTIDYENKLKSYLDL